MLGRLKESIDKGIVSMSVKSSTYVEVGKLREKIGNATERINGIINEMGGGVYQHWKNGAVDNTYIEQMCGRIKTLEENVMEYQRQIEELEQEKEKILTGETGDSWTTEGQGAAVPCVCGRMNVAGSKFCAGCGKELEQEEAKGPEKPKAICTKCGRELEVGAKFCAGCGTAVSK